MPWKQNELATLFASIYRGSFRCPTCNGDLDVTPSREIGAVGIVRCDACASQHFVAVSNDPLRSQFRAYTKPEQDAIVEKHKAGITPTCPVDGTAMWTSETPTLGAGTHVVVQCRRCGQNTQYRRTA